MGLELAQEVPALPDAYGLEHGVPTLRGTQRNKPGRNPDSGLLVQLWLNELSETGKIDHPGADDEAALPRRVVEDVEVHEGCNSVGRTLQGVQLARLYKGSLPPETCARAHRRV